MEFQHIKFIPQINVIIAAIYNCILQLHFSTLTVEDETNFKYTV